MAVIFAVKLSTNYWPMHLGLQSFITQTGWKYSGGMSTEVGKGEWCTGGVTRGNQLAHSTHTDEKPG